MLTAMCLTGSVGRGGSNARDDVRTVQLLLNLNAPQVVGPMVADGVCGTGTIAAIELYQRGVIGGKDAPGLVTPSATGGTTLHALQAGMALGFTAEKLQGIYIHAGGATVATFFAPIVAGMARADMTTALRRAHFLAQVGHESGELRYTEELASGSAYEGRADLGNCEPGDGPRFKGRGLIQLTGRSNYRAFSAFCRQDFCAVGAQNRIATDPSLAVDAAIWYWQTHKLNALADDDDVVTLTKRINGGLNGLEDRKRLLLRAKWFLFAPAPDPETIKLMQAMGAAGEDLEWGDADAIW